MHLLPSSRLLTEREKQLLGARQFDVIIHEQRQKDEAIEAKVCNTKILHIYQPYDYS